MRKWMGNLLAMTAAAALMVLLLELFLRAVIYFSPEKAARLFIEPAPTTIGMTAIASDGRTHLKGDTLDKRAHKFINHPFVIYRNYPNESGPDPYREASTFKVNSAGLRGEEVSRQKEAGVFRIVVTGGSVAFGVHASSDDATWSSRLQEKLNACGAFPGRVEVLNAGVLGYIAVQELLYLQMELLDFSPDLVLALNGFNDFLVATSETSGCTKPVEEDLIYFVYRDLANSLEQYAWDRKIPVSAQISDLMVDLVTQAYIGKFFYRRIKTYRERPAPAQASTDAGGPKDDMKLDICREVVEKVYQRNLEKMARMLVSRNIALLIAVQPHLLLKSRPAPDEEAIIQADLAESPQYRQLTEATYPLLVHAAKAAAAEHQPTAFMDLTLVFGTRPEPMFVDDAHLTDPGNDVVADALAEYLCRNRPIFVK